MRGTLRHVIIFFVLALLCVSGFFWVRHVLQLPFRPTNDAFHEKDSSFNLDFLIPAGTHLDEKMTIKEVLKLRLEKKKSPFEGMLRAISDVIPVRYRYLADLLLFSFWVFCFMTFLRVFTFMGYPRALRGSLVLGGITFYFMPDFLPGRTDDLIFLGVPVSITVLRAYLVRRKKKRDRSRA